MSIVGVGGWDMYAKERRGGARVGLFCLVISVKGLTWVSASLLVQGGLIHTSFFSV